MFRFKSHQRKTKSLKGKCKLDYQLPLFGLKFKVSSFISFMAWTGMTFCVLMILVSLALLPFQKKERGKGCGTLNENAEDYLFRAKWIRSFDIPFIYSF